MAKLLTEIYTLHNKINANDINLSITTGKFKHKKSRVLVPKFKQQLDFPPEDIKAIRRMINVEREQQDEEVFKLWSSDYDRMMKDDWLVSRFLIRGLKASQKQISSNRINCKKESSVLLYNLTMDLIKACAKYRIDYQINGLTTIDEFPVDWIKTDGIFNYKPDLVGNPTIYLRIKLHKPKLVESEDSRFKFKRLLLFFLEKCDRDLFNNPGKGVCCVFDMSEATLENIDLELVSWMIKSSKSCSPKLLCYVIVYNLPWFFSATFKLISNTLMSNSNRQSLKFVYGNEILDFINHKNLPSYLKDKVEDANK